MIVLLLASLISAKVSDARLERIPPQERQQGTFDTLRAFLLGESQRQPVVVVLDDVQWIDRTSEEVLTHLIRSASTHRLLLIVCYRPEYRPKWASQSVVIPLALKPFNEVESRRLVEAALGESRLDLLLVRLVSERSEGNPFFIEELLNAFIEKGIVIRDEQGCRLARGGAPVEIPNSIQDVIMARIDQLEEPLKRILQIAAVIGRDFSFKVLRAVAGTGEELRRSLIQLADLELIREKTIFPEWEFSFKNALTQEVAYAGLLSRRRQELHERVGRVMEQLAEDRVEDFYEELAQHLARSANAERGVHYLVLAGDKAVKHFAMDDARSYYQNAADLLANLPESESSLWRAQDLKARLSSLGQPKAWGSDLSIA